MKLKQVRSALLVAALTCSMIVTPVMAAPADTGSLQNQKESTEKEVSGLQAQLNELFMKTNELETQLISKGQEITKAKEDLAVAEEKRQQQYEDMKLRIKYMYEEGDTSAVERIISSGSISEMLTQTEYVEKVHKYDRDKLDEYVNTVQEVENLKNTLEADMTKLQNLDEEYKTQTAELSDTIESKRAEVSNLDAMIQEAARAAVEAAKKEEEKNNGGNPSQGGTQGSTGGSPNSGEPTTPSQPTPEPTPTPDPIPQPQPEPTPTPTPPQEPGYNPSTGNAVVDRAYSWVGKAEYEWGACRPGAFDCSGFVAYCLTGAYSRLGTTYTFLGWPRVSNPQPGDVAVNENHCGIYIGNGQMIHAADYGIGVIVGPVQSGMVYVRY